MTIRLFLPTLVTLAATMLTACGSRGPTTVEAAAPEPQATAHNTVILPSVTYGKTPEGLQLSKSDDPCDVPASLATAIEEQLEEPYAFTVPQPSPSVAGAPTLRIQIIDILANAGGLYGGPKIVHLHGVLERPNAPAAEFTAKRQMFLYFGLPRSTCSMVGSVAYDLGGDITAWLKNPADGAKLGQQ
ncbi:MAG: hypothetical protein IBJ14_01945 [Hydrogenophaga sp.]|nr:hypothetical protein [Hydrogenophaga sp.]